MDRKRRQALRDENRVAGKKSRVGLRPKIASDYEEEVLRLFAEPLPTTLCVFCGKDESFGKMTKEHFVPKGLWDSVRPNKTRTVPAHFKCNNSYSDDNDYFRDVFALDSEASNHPEAEKLAKGTLNRKRRNRPRAFAKSLKNARFIPEFTESGIFVGNGVRFEVDWDRIKRVLRNIMRGIFYTTQKRPMAQNMELEVCHIDRVSQLEPVEHLIAKMVPWQGFGDDVFACRYVFNNTREDYMVCLMRFYGARLFFGSAMQPGWQERARTQELASKEN